MKFPMNWLDFQASAIGGLGNFTNASPKNRPNKIEKTRGNPPSLRFGAASPPFAGGFTAWLGDFIGGDLPDAAHQRCNFNKPTSSASASCTFVCSNRCVCSSTCKFSTACCGV